MAARSSRTKKAEPEILRQGRYRWYVTLLPAPQIRSNSNSPHSLPHLTRTLPHRMFKPLQQILTYSIAQESQSRAIFTSLRKTGVLSQHDGSLHTENITKHLLNQLPAISIHATRKLISLLFFWEEEIIYSQVLDLQEDEATEAIAATGGEGRREDFVTLEGVKRRRALPPSQREIYVRGRRESAPPPPYEA